METLTAYLGYPKVKNEDLVLDGGGMLQAAIFLQLVSAIYVMPIICSLLKHCWLQLSDNINGISLFLMFQGTRG